MKQGVEFNINLVDDAKQKLLMQYKNSPKFVAWIEALIKPIDGFRHVYQQFVDALDIDKASGVLLDRIGVIVGANRILDGVSLDDANYRKLIRATIARNHCKATIPGVIDALEFLFDGAPFYLYESPDKSMVIGLVVAGFLSTFEQDLLFKYRIFPKPSGVRYETIKVLNSGRAFVFDDTTVIALPTGSFDDTTIDLPGEFID